MMLLSITAIPVFSMVKNVMGLSEDEPSCFVPIYSDRANVVSHPECDDLSGFGGWGAKSVNTDLRYVYCGDKSIAVASPWGGTLEVNNLLPNTVYRLHAYVYIPEGISAIINAYSHGYEGGDIDLWTSTKNDEWEVVDFTYKTNNVNTTGLYYTGSTGSGSVYIDNYELYIVEEPSIRIQYVDENGISLKEERVVVGEWGHDVSKYLMIGQEYVAEKDKKDFVVDDVKYTYDTESNSDRILVEEGENLLQIHFKKFEGLSQNAELKSISVVDAQMYPSFSPEVTEYEVWLAGASSVQPVCEKQEDEQSIAGDGIVDLSTGEGRSEIEVLAEDGETVKKYILKYKSVPSDDAFVPTCPELENMVKDPFCNTLGSFGGWGTKSVNTDLRYVYSGNASIAVGSPFRGTLELNNLKPNTVYRFIAQTYSTQGVTAQFGWFGHGLGNGDINFYLDEDKNNVWQKADFTLKTSNAGGGVYFVGVSAEGSAYIDNYEVYEIEKEPVVRIHIQDVDGNAIKDDVVVRGDWTSMSPSRYLMLGHDFVANAAEYESFMLDGVYYELDRNISVDHIILQEGENELVLKYNAIVVPPATYVWVSPSGDDLAQGTELAPLLTLQVALARVREMRQTATEPLGEIHVVLKGGIYRMNETLTLNGDDSGKPYSPTIIEAAEGETPVLSGGVEISGWRPAGNVDKLPEVAQQHVWMATTPKLGGNNLDFRQLYVNGVKMKRASTFDDLSMPRLISVDKKEKTLDIPRPKEFDEVPENVELTIVQDWTVNHMRVETAEHSDYRTTLTFKQPESDIEFKRPWPILRAEENSFSNHCYYFSNALELLNRPQEWFNNANSGTVYYWPRFGESVNSIEAIAPVHETLVRIEGDLDKMVSNIVFRGISFEHTTWMRPSTDGQVSLQSGQYLFDAYSDPSVPAGNVAYVGRPSAGVSVKNARHIDIEDCLFQHMASTAVDFVSGTKQVKVEGCAFNDIGGTAVQVGFFGDENIEVHQAYNPEDKRLVCDSVLINNNYIVNTANEDWGCNGICVGFAANVNILHNELHGLPYSAITMGWGWNKAVNCMHNNHITANYINGFATQMRDAGAIYTLSAQLNSSITENRIEGVGHPLFDPVMWNMRHSQFDIYTDEGSDYFVVKDNWCSRGEINRNQNGDHNVWGTNNSNVDESIKQAAGLEEKFAYIRDKVVAFDYAPIDSICERNTSEHIEFVAQNEGFKLGSVLAVDLNNDNKLDIVYGGGESFQVQHGGVRMNTGDYGFVATQGIKELYMNNLVAGDLNGDGYIDLVQSGWDFWDGYNGVLMNDGNGHLEEMAIDNATKPSPACGIADVDNDGLTDYFFIGGNAADNFYIQKPDRTFAKPVSKLALPEGFQDPHVMYADFNNDKSVDLCILSSTKDGVYTKVWYNDGNGNFTETNVGFTEKGTRGAMAYADVNADGYLDIVVGGRALGEEWDTPAEQGGQTVTLYLNDGNGMFVKHQDFSEYAFDNVTRPIRFCDWNNDGYSDLILTGWNISHGNVSQTDVYLNDGQGNFTLSDIDLPGVSESSIELADFSNTGKNDILISGNCNGGYNGFTADRRIAVLCKNPVEKSNAAPLPPTVLAANVTKNEVQLMWNAGSDAETDAKSLSYNFYIRDLATGLYVVSPNADSVTGERRISGMGNAWMNLGWTLRSLPAGTYAWSVQTVDAGYRGSAFAQEQTFVVEDETGIEDCIGEAKTLQVKSFGESVNINVLQPQQVSVFTADGRCVYTNFCQTGSFNLPLPSGFYMVNSIKIIVGN